MRHDQEPVPRWCLGLPYAGSRRLTWSERQAFSRATLWPKLAAWCRLVGVAVVCLLLFVASLGVTEGLAPHGRPVEVLAVAFFLVGMLGLALLIQAGLELPALLHNTVTVLLGGRADTYAGTLRVGYELVPAGEVTIELLAATHELVALNGVAPEEPVQLEVMAYPPEGPLALFGLSPPLDGALRTERPLLPHERNNLWQHVWVTGGCVLLPGTAVAAAMVAGAVYLWRLDPAEGGFAIYHAITVGAVLSLLAVAWQWARALRDARGGIVRVTLAPVADGVLLAERLPSGGVWLGAGEGPLAMQPYELMEDDEH